jgi:restriction endonuclease S subunit
MPSNQVNVSAAELKRIAVYVAPYDFQREVAKLVRTAYERRKQGLAKYEYAQQLLESELGLDKLSFQKPTGFKARFSDLEQTRRSDAQHYQPRFAQLLEHLSTFPSRKVRDLRTYNRRGVQPFYVKNGEIAVVNSQHLGPKHIDYEGLQKTTTALFLRSPEAHIKPNDLLIYSTGAYVGRTNVYLKEAPALASNHVNILRMVPGIDAAYMALVFQSDVGQFQTQKHARGSAQAELYPADIDRFVVPVIDPEAQLKIGNLVRESLTKQKESERLLEEAKTRVEQLIEEAVKS